MPSPLTLETLDMHTAGEPVRIVTAGYPELEGDTILEKRRNALERHDHIRKLLMLEPRGHAEMYGVIPVASSLPGAAFGVLFMHNSGYSTMCGHATIALGRWAVETNRVQLQNNHAAFVLECPCGPVNVTVKRLDNDNYECAFESVPAFVLARDIAVETTFGTAAFDIAYGGAYYAIAPARRLGLDLRSSPLGALREAAMGVTQALRTSHKIDHPGAADLGFLYGTILTDDHNGADQRASANLCVFGEGQIDRSPTGSGVTARLALAHAREGVNLGATRRYMGPSGLAFDGELAETTTFSGRPAIRARISGRAHISGLCRFVLEPSDALSEGLFLAAENTVPAWEKRG